MDVGLCHFCTLFSYFLFCCPRTWKSFLGPKGRVGGMVDRGGGGGGGERLRNRGCGGVAVGEGKEKLAGG